LKTFKVLNAKRNRLIGAVFMKCIFLVYENKMNFILKNKNIQNYKKIIEIILKFFFRHENQKDPIYLKKFLLAKKFVHAKSLYLTFIR